MRLRAVLLLLTCACGRVNFAERAQPVARCAWEPPIFAGEPTALGINTANGEGDPTLSFDALELYYYTNVGPETRVMRSTRASRSDSFESGVPLADLESIPGSMSGFFLQRDGLSAYFAWRQGPHSDLYRIDRESPTAAFGPPVALTELNTPGHEFNPRLSPDGHTLVFVRWTDVDDPNTADAMLGHRASPDEPWSEIERASYSSPLPEAASGFVGDTNTVVFETDGELLVATRARDDLPYERASPLALNTDAFDGIPFPSADGCELVFMSDRNGPLEVFGVNLEAD